MKLKNIGDKVVSIGNTALMPGAEMTITEDQVRNLPSLQVLAGRGFIAFEQEMLFPNAPKEEAEPVAEAEPQEASADTTAKVGRRRGANKVTKTE